MFTFLRYNYKIRTQTCGTHAPKLIPKWFTITTIPWISNVSKLISKQRFDQHNLIKVYYLRCTCSQWFNQCNRYNKCKSKLWLSKGTCLTDRLRPTETKFPLLVLQSLGNKLCMYNRVREIPYAVPYTYLIQYVCILIASLL